MVRVTVTDEVPMAGFDFPIESLLLVSVQERDFLVRKRHASENTVTRLACLQNCFTENLAGAVTVSQDKIRWDFPEQSNHFGRADVSTVDNSRHIPFFERQNRVKRSSDVPMCVADDSQIHF